MKKHFFLALMITLIGGCSTTLDEITHESAANDTPSSDLKLWFNTPATRWDNGIPIGNGRIGAMLHGSPEAETLTLNEDTVWSGMKRYDRDMPGAAWIPPIRELLFAGDYSKADKLVEEKLLSQRHKSGSYSYQMLGKLHLESPGLANATNYHRELDLDTAIAKVSFEAEGIKYTREYFVSAPDQVMVMKISADHGGQNRSQHPFRSF